MTETCINGHIRTEENTSWVKRGDRPGLRRKCLDCRRSNKPTAAERSSQGLRERLEDLEDLISFGATFNEIVERSAYAHWGSMREALRRAGRTDLLEAMQRKLDEGQVNIEKPVRPTRNVCKVRSCSRKHKALGYCSLHRERVRRHGNALVTLHRKVCSIRNCNEKHRANGFCNKHRLRYRKQKVKT